MHGCGEEEEDSGVPQGAWHESEIQPSCWDEEEEQMQVDTLDDARVLTVETRLKKGRDQAQENEMTHN